MKNQEPVSSLGEAGSFRFWKNEKIIAWKCEVWGSKTVYKGEDNKNK